MPPHNAPRIALQPKPYPKNLGESHPRWRIVHRLSAHESEPSHYHGLQGNYTTPYRHRNPTPQIVSTPNDVKHPSTMPHEYYIHAHDNTPEVVRHESAIDYKNSSFNISTNLGTPVAPRSLIWVRGLRIIEVSGSPGSTT